LLVPGRPSRALTSPAAADHLLCAGGGRGGGIGALKRQWVFVRPLLINAPQLTGVLEH